MSNTFYPTTMPDTTPPGGTVVKSYIVIHVTTQIMPEALYFPILPDTNSRGHCCGHVVDNDQNHQIGMEGFRFLLDATLSQLACPCCMACTWPSLML